MNFIMQPFRMPSYQNILGKELDEAKRSLLKAQTGLEYATAMVAYHTARVKRLEASYKDEPAVPNTLNRFSDPDFSGPSERPTKKSSKTSVKLV